MRSYRFTLAEDDPKDLLLVYTLLSAAFPGSRMATFSSAEDAMRHILDAGTDLLITDHGMGEMSGIDLVRELRSRGLQIPLIVISGDREIEKEARLAGATEFFEKKGNCKELEKCIRRVLRESEERTKGLEGREFP